MKKISLFLCTGLLMVSLAACGNAGNNENGQGSSAVQNSPAPTESSIGQTGNDGQQGSSAQGSGAQNGSPELGSSLGTDSNGHDYTQGWTEEMEAVKKAVTDELGENYLPSMALTPDLLESAVGITSDMYDDYLAEMPMISVNVDTLLIIKAKDGKVDEVETALNAYRDAKIADTMQYPMNVPKIQASRIAKIGNYVCFVQLGAGVSDVIEQGEEAALVYCQGENDRVIEILKQQLE